MANTKMGDHLTFMHFVFLLVMTTGILGKFASSAGISENLNCIQRKNLLRIALFIPLHTKGPF